MFYSQLYICIYFKIIYLCALFSSCYTLILCCLIVVGAAVRTAAAAAPTDVIRLRSPFHLVYQFPSNHIEIDVHNKTLPRNTSQRKYRQRERERGRAHNFCHCVAYASYCPFVRVCCFWFIIFLNVVLDTLQVYWYSELLLRFTWFGLFNCCCCCVYWWCYWCYCCFSSFAFFATNK